MIKINFNWYNQHSSIKSTLSMSFQSVGLILSRLTPNYFILVAISSFWTSSLVFISFCSKSLYNCLGFIFECFYFQFLYTYCNYRYCFSNLSELSELFPRKLFASPSSSPSKLLKTTKQGIIQNTFGSLNSSKSRKL